MARQPAALGLLLDLPDTVVVTHDLVSTAAGDAVRRVITDRSGVLADEATPLDHACLSCTVREDVLPTLQLLLTLGRWSTITLSLPLTASPEPVSHQIQLAIGEDHLDGTRLASVVSLVDLTTLGEDLLGNDLLSERDLALDGADRRSVGEALAAQIEFADDVVTVDTGAASARTLLTHLVAPTSRLHLGWDEVVADDLAAFRHDPETARRRVGPLQVRPSGAGDGHGVWTVESCANQPLHPDRLLKHVEAPGSGRVRTRGHFWLAARREIACVWDGSGGQLSIGHVGPWGNRPAGTRIVVTGENPAGRRRIVDTFPRVVSTPPATSGSIILTIASTTASPLARSPRRAATQPHLRRPEPTQTPRLVASLAATRLDVPCFNPSCR